MSTYTHISHPGWRRRRTKGIRTQATRIFIDSSDDVRSHNAQRGRSNARTEVSAWCDNEKHSRCRMDDCATVGSSPGRGTARLVDSTTRAAEYGEGGGREECPQRPQRQRESGLAAWGIPPGYSVVNWDCKEVPIVLLGSVFDANSLGKWVYDWTVHECGGGGAPIPQVAADLWLLLIKLAANIQSLKGIVGRVYSVDDRETVDEFVSSGARLWRKFGELVKTCEGFMWRAAMVGDDGALVMGEEAGEEFVETMFGRDRQLERVERWMSSARLWNMRFDANCESMVRAAGRRRRERIMSELKN